MESESSESMEPVQAAESAGDSAAESAEVQRLADVVRRVVHGTRVTTVSAEDEAKAKALIAEAAAILEGSTYDGPYWQTGLTAIEQFAPSNDLGQLFRYSPAFGKDNPVAPNVQLEIDGDRIRGVARFEAPYGGPPWSLTHGGILALVYDDVLGMAAMLGAGGGLTAQLQVNYRKPTPLHETIEIEAWMEQHDGRKYIARGEMRCNGELLTDANALFIRPRAYDEPGS